MMNECLRNICDLIIKSYHSCIRLPIIYTLFLCLFARLWACRRGFRPPAHCIFPLVILYSKTVNHGLYALSHIIKRHGIFTLQFDVGGYINRCVLLRCSWIFNIHIWYPTWSNIQLATKICFILFCIFVFLNMSLFQKLIK